MNILNWDVWNNRYYDDEVNYLKMIRLMNTLVGMNEILCPGQLYQLYLDLHLRVSYLARHNPDKNARREIYSSLRNLQQYVLRNQTFINEQEATALAGHLIWMGKFFHANETIDMARELLSKYADHEGSQELAGGL